MDFWSRLIGGLGASSHTKAGASSAQDPAQRLARFRKIYSQLLAIWQKSVLNSSSHIRNGGANGATAGISSAISAYAPAARSHLQRLNEALRQDVRAPAPHQCLTFTAVSAVYADVSRVACSFGILDAKTDNIEEQDRLAIVAEAIAIFGTLVDSEEEELLRAQPFANALTTLADGILGSSQIPVDEDIEADTLELIFGIAAKIRLEPDLLHVWFTAEPAVQENGSSTNDNSEKSPQARTIDGFPLCHQFIGRVYREGRIGDFARTGLLYIFEVASESKPLEEWIIESDLATLMASGLGALYSQLGRKLTINHPENNLPLILALADADHAQPAIDVDDFFSPAIQTQLDTFISYLIFWQDILEHCKSVGIRQTLIDHFHLFFLQQILYPSLLESSDVDGGSSVAVLTYLWRILSSIDHPDLIQKMLHYLLALPEVPDDVEEEPDSPVAKKRRESLSIYEPPPDAVSPSLFNLVDLCLASLQSPNAQTVLAALRLVTVLIAKHHGYALDTLLKTTAMTRRTSVLSPTIRTIGVLKTDVETLLALSERLGSSVDGLDEAYENCLKDALGLIESHPCARDMLRVGEPSGDARKFSRERILHKASLRGVVTIPHALILDDALLKSLLTIMANFFTNDVETNLAVTEALASLAACPFLRLEGWLASSGGSTREAADSDEEMETEINPENNTHNPSSTTVVLSAVEQALKSAEEAEQQRLNQFRTARHYPSITSNISTSPPTLITILEDLTTQLDRASTNINDFSHLLASRRRAFVGAAEHDKSFAAGLHSPNPFVSASLNNTPLRSNSPRSSIDTPRSQSISRFASPGPGLEKRAMSPLPLPLPQMSLSRNNSNRGRGMRASSPNRPVLPRPSSPLKNVSPSPVSRFPLPELPASPPPASPTSPRKGLNITLPRPVTPDQNTNLEGDLEGDHKILDRMVVFDDVDDAAEMDDEAQKDEDGEEETERTTGGTDKENSNGNAKKGKKKKKKNKERKAPLTNVLTNALILQEFALELAAILQVRGSLVEGEVRFI